MVVSKSDIYISPEEYLEGEKSSPVKHEYIQGQVYAMAGANDAHNLITGSFYSLLRNHLRGKGCLPYTGDMKAQIDVRDIYYYPDILVICDPRDRSSEYSKRYPCLIVEVLSDSTEAFDRGNKFSDYRHLETLQEYVLVKQDRQSVDCFRRNEQGRWELYAFVEGDEVVLKSIDFSCAIASLYEDVILGIASA
ncbi:MAG: Uma2 family endonuclease [Acaryochloridaceae cyanobacterium RU_4_10]|nr:Uma2 family endonuclease [Acaryochloridaceae cyanobacterium RU_4_10]